MFKYKTLPETNYVKNKKAIQKLFQIDELYNFDAHLFSFIV